MTDRVAPTWFGAVEAGLAEAAGRGERRRRERAGQLARTQPQVPEETTAADGHPTLGAAVGKMLDEQDRAAYDPWAHTGDGVSLHDAVDTAVTRQRMRTDEKQRELREAFGFGDREPGRVER